MPQIMFGLQAREFLQRPDHGVERVGDADHEGLGGILLDALADRLHHLEVDADQVVAAHAGLARHAGGDDDHVGALDVLIGLRADVGGVEAVDRRGFGDVEPLALRDAFGDVEQHDVAEFLQPGEMGERAADLAGADEGDLLAGHCLVLLSWRCEMPASRPKRVFLWPKPAFCRNPCRQGRSKHPDTAGIRRPRSVSPRFFKGLRRSTGPSRLRTDQQTGNYNLHIM